MSDIMKHEEGLQALGKVDFNHLLVSGMVIAFISKLPDIIEALGRIDYRLSIQTKIGSINLEPATTGSTAS